MSKIDGGLWGWLNKTKHQFKSDLHMTRVENEIGTGMPDVEGKLRGRRAFWIELKKCRVPKRTDTPMRPPIRPGQKSWIYKRALVGGSVWLLVRAGKDRFLIHGSHIRAVYENGFMPNEISKIGFKVKDPAEVIRIVSSKYSVQESCT